MKPGEKIVAFVLSLIILGAIGYLLLFATLGSLGAIDGQSYEVDRFAIIGFVTFCFVGGYIFVRWQSGKR